MVLILLKDMLYKDCFSRILLSRNYLRCFKMALLCSLVKYLFVSSCDMIFFKRTHYLVIWNLVKNLHWKPKFEYNLKVYYLMVDN